MTNVAMISGASRGMGYAIAQKLFSEGWSVSLGVRDVQKQTKICGDWQSDRLQICHYEAQNKESAQTWFNATVKRWPSLKALINCAGVLKTTSWLDEQSDAELSELWQVNAVAPLQLTRVCFEALKVHGEGRVINVVSLSGLRVKAKMAGYPMSKHAQLAFHHAMRHTGYEFGIRATAICPGYTNTEMVKDFSPQDPKLMTQPEDVADMVNTILNLPNSSSVSVVPMNSLMEDLY